MTDERREAEASEEAIEDLQAPAEAQHDVAGGGCNAPTCSYSVLCLGGTCKFTRSTCEGGSGKIIIFDHE
jgi:hypothetical protein